MDAEIFSSVEHKRALENLVYSLIYFKLKGLSVTRCSRSPTEACGSTHLVYFVASVVMFQARSAKALVSPMIDMANKQYGAFANAEYTKLIAL